MEQVANNLNTVLERVCANKYLFRVWTEDDLVFLQVLGNKIDNAVQLCFDMQKEGILDQKHCSTYRSDRRSILDNLQLTFSAIEQDLPSLLSLV